MASVGRRSPSCESVTALFSVIRVREMEAADWASLSDQELLEHRISSLGLRLEGTAARTAYPASL